MIHVENLTKTYGQTTAIDGVSFDVAKGEVVGFLGPNGAGKTTTMRILCGCIGASGGKALIDGLSVLEHPLQVKRRIGYLPEIPPLYGTMPVRDFVAFAARIKGVADPVGAAAHAIELVGLGEVAHRIIDHLSKGFRQRVGLAQALVHDPEVLVLDEPSSGLDPRQRREIRKLLAKLAAGQRTVILSTHVLGEVEALCDRVVIVNRGRVVAEDRIDALDEGGGQLRLRVARPTDDLAGTLAGLPGVQVTRCEAPGVHELHVASDAAREAVATLAVAHGLIELSPLNRLEDIYLRLTSEEGS
jgi:ABC-2 type transport system ATP-binding protein